MMGEVWSSVFGEADRTRLGLKYMGNKINALEKDLWGPTFRGGQEISSSRGSKEKEGANLSCGGRYAGGAPLLPLK